MELLRPPAASDRLKVFGTLTCGGRLIVTNVGGTALEAGDTFKLLDAAVITGGFESLTLPALNGNLFWNTNNLLADGTLTVAAPTPPVFGSINTSGTNLIFTGSGGIPNANYYLIGTTNLTLPAANWTLLITNQFDSSGNFIFTNAMNPNWPQGYYRIQLP
jgi:hypothetical protein